MSTRPKISAPFNPVHLGGAPSSEYRHERNASTSSLSPDTSPYLRPVSPASSSGSSPQTIRNFSRPTTPQNPKISPPPQGSARRGKGLFKEENLDSMSPTTGAATAPHTMIPGSNPFPEARRGSASSSHLLPPSPSMRAQFISRDNASGNLQVPPSPTSPAQSKIPYTTGPQAPPTPTSPSFLLTDPESNSHSHFGYDPPPSPGFPGQRPSQEYTRRPSQEFIEQRRGSADTQGSGLVSGERKRSMWERVLRRESDEGEGFPKDTRL